jgi:hypothetical protein
MIVNKCTFEGCAVLTIGSRCAEHDVPVARAFPRGRPYGPERSSTVRPDARTPAQEGPSHTVGRKDLAAAP